MLIMAAALPISAHQANHPHQPQAADALGLNVTDASLKRNAGLMTVDMNLGLADFDLDGNRAAVFAPVLVNGTDTSACGYRGRRAAGRACRCR